MRESVETEKKLQGIKESEGNAARVYPTNLGPRKPTQVSLEPSLDPSGYLDPVVP